MTARDLEQQLREFQRCVIERDGVAVEGVLDREFALVLVYPELVVMPRRRWLEVLPDYVVHEWVVEECQLDESGDGFAGLLQRVQMRATVLGEDRSGQFVISDLWRVRDGSWRVWRRHSTPLLAGVMPGA